MVTRHPGWLTAEQVDMLHIQVYQTRRAMGAAAGLDVAQRLRDALSQQPQARIIFAAAPSQNELLEALAHADHIDWSRVVVFHMDEYLGLPADAPQRFGQFLSDRLFDLVHPGQVNLIGSASDDPSAWAQYATRLAEAPIDIVCLGIGENGHIAFNDPAIADFNDPAPIKPVTLDLASRQQQVNDGCFATLSDVPHHAVTLTIPTLMAGKALFCVVPGASKRAAVRQALREPISPAHPASILRRHPHCVLYLDGDSYDQSDSPSQRRQEPADTLTAPAAMQSEQE